jgi:hypothetical protein
MKIGGRFATVDSWDLGKDEHFCNRRCYGSERTCFPIIPIDNLDEIILATGNEIQESQVEKRARRVGRKWSKRKKRGVTYHGSQKPLSIFIQPPQRVHSIRRPAHQLPRLGPCTSDIVEYAL